MPFPALTNDRLLRVIRGERVDKTPVWIMRQAGRYLPEFRETRKDHDFFTICRTPELACRVTMQPIDRYEGLFDASIIFSDILVIPQALGMTVEMVPGKGPHFPDPLQVPADTEKLRTAVNVREELGYVFDAITLTRKTLDGRVPLFGFAGAPWTIMAYMIEGGGSKTLSKAKRWLSTFPRESKELLQRITDVTVDYLVGQVMVGGAQVLQVFDSWAGELGQDQFEEFSLPYLKQIATRVKQACGEARLPMVVFAKGAHYAVDLLLPLDYDVLGLDWTMNVREVKEKVRKYWEKTGIRKSLQGNMDPAYLYGPPEFIQTQAERVLEQFLLKEDGTVEEDVGYVCNLGHGIQPEVPPENVQVFLQTVDRVSRRILGKSSSASKGQ